MACIATSFTGFNDCRTAVGGVSELYVALWDSEFAGNLTYEGDFVTGENKKLAWRELPVNLITESRNELVSEGDFTDTLVFQVAGKYVEDRAIKNWLNYNKLVFVIVGAGGAYISGEENGNETTQFVDSTSTEGNGSSANWTFQAKTTYVNYGVASEYLEKIKESAVCGDYTDLFALNNDTTIQEQFDCVVGDYTGFVP